MRIFYTDEAGTSEREPVRLVAGVVLEPDSQFDEVCDELEKAFDRLVPKEIRDGFYFHAKEVFNGGQYRDVWPHSNRIQLFCEVLAICWRLNLPVVVSTVFSNSLDAVYSDLARTQKDEDQKLKKHEFEFITAYVNAIERANHFVEKYASGQEKFVVVSEDIQKLRRQLKKYGVVYRHSPLKVTSSFYRMSETDRDKLGDDTITLSSKHLIDSPHFIEPRDAPILQVADALCFAFRRYLARHSYGAELVSCALGSITAHQVVLEDKRWLEGPSTQQLFYNYKDHLIAKNIMNAMLSAN